MSLVPTFVLAQDGKLYENPVLQGSGWYLCFDDDDPPELVIKVSRGMKRSMYRKLAENTLREAGIQQYARLSFQHVSGRMIGTAASFFLDLKEPIPVPQKFDAALEEYPAREGVVYNFGRPYRIGTRVQL